MEYIEYTDPRCEAEFTLPYFDIETTPEDLLIKYSDVVNDAIFCALGNLVDNPEWEQVPCLLTDNRVFDVTRADYQNQLDICLDHYVKNEDYEKAGLLNSFKKELEK